MLIPEYIGDEVSAAGYRLAGLAVNITDTTMTEEALLSLIQQVSTRTSLLLIGSETANRLRQSKIDMLLASVEPALVIVPDIRCHAPAPDLASRLRTQLGMIE